MNGNTEQLTPTKMAQTKKDQPKPYEIDLKDQIIVNAMEYNGMKKEIAELKAQLAGMKGDFNRFLFRLNNLHEQEPIVKDSGLWQIRTEDLDEVILQQEVNEPFDQFIYRRFGQDNQIKYAFDERNDPNPRINQKP